MRRERDLGRARDLGKPDTADRDLAPVLPHTTSLGWQLHLHSEFVTPTAAGVPAACNAARALDSRVRGNDAEENTPCMIPPHWADIAGANRNCGNVMSSFSFSNTTSTRRPTLASVYSASNRLPAISAPGASSSSTMMLA